MTIEAEARAGAHASGVGARDGDLIPVATVVAALCMVWYVGAAVLNAPSARMIAENSSQSLSFGELIGATWSLERPVLPAPHQVVGELWATIAQVAPTSRRSLLYHAWVTFSATALGFIIGALFGMALAILIVHVRTLKRSLMPWIIASQTVPILAIAPIIIVVLGASGISGLLPKAIISAYLCFFPVTIGMAKGLSSAEATHFDLMRSYHASQSQIFWKLRLPASIPFLFASLKVSAAISLTGAIVGELPTGAQSGLGARLLAGSYYGQTLQIWAALFVAAALAAAIVGAVAFIERIVLSRMGARDGAQA